MINKYQEGGQLTDTQQLGLQYLALMYAQQTGKDPQQDQEGFMQFVQQLAQQAGVQDMGQLLDMVYQQAQGQAQAARKGAKLNYLKRLSGKCPEGQELVYFKAGGKTCFKCEKKLQGDEIEYEKCGSKMKKKKGCDGLKIRKGQKGLNFDFWETMLRKFSNPYKTRNKQIKGRPILETTERNGVSRTVVGNGNNMPNDTIYVRMLDRHPNIFWDNRTDKEIYNNLKPRTGRTNYDTYPLKGYMDAKLQLKNGGSLNGVPFKQPGGIFNPNKNYWQNTVNVESSLQVPKSTEPNKKNSIQEWLKMFNRLKSLNKSFDTSPVTLFQSGGINK